MLANDANELELRPHTTLTVVGLGLTGSYFVDHLGRLPGLRRVHLIDLDTYSDANLPAQNISLESVGQLKVEVQAQRLRRLNPALDVVTFAQDVAAVPWGCWRAELVVSCLDALEPRLVVHQACWRQGIPFLDAGVNATGPLVRISRYQPGKNEPCFECGLETEDYTSGLKTVYACVDRRAGNAPTRGTSSTGALAAALLAIECAKHFAGDHENTLAGHHVVMAPAHHRYYLTHCPRRSLCRFDHQTWRIERVRGLEPSSSLRHLWHVIRHQSGLTGPTMLVVAGHQFARLRVCPRCGFGSSGFCLFKRIAPTERRCPQCQDQELHAVGMEMVDGLDEKLDPRLLDHSLDEAGLRPGDVLTLHNGSEARHFELHWQNSVTAPGSSQPTPARKHDDRRPEYPPRPAHSGQPPCGLGASGHRPSASAYV